MKIKDAYWKHIGLHLRFQDSQEKDSSETRPSPQKCLLHYIGTQTI